MSVNFKYCLFVLLSSYAVAAAAAAAVDFNYMKIDIINELTFYKQEKRKSKANNLKLEWKKTKIVHIKCKLMHVHWSVG